MSRGSEGITLIVDLAWGHLWRGRILFELLTNPACHTKVADATYSHLVNKNVFEFQVGMDKAHLLVEVSNAAGNLAEKCTGVIMRECRTTVTFKDIVECARGAKKHEEKVGVMCLGRVEKRENVLVR
jgi:hypothetical protein